MPLMGWFLLNLKAERPLISTVIPYLGARVGQPFSFSLIPWCSHLRSLTVGTSTGPYSGDTGVPYISVKRDEPAPGQADGQKDDSVGPGIQINI